MRALVIPPAWRQVWIRPRPHGHLQAVGTDDAGLCPNCAPRSPSPAAACPGPASPPAPSACSTSASSALAATGTPAGASPTA
ncbi:hypothetical protein [Streptomyces sp. NPDC001492]